MTAAVRARRRADELRGLGGVRPRVSPWLDRRIADLALPGGDDRAGAVLTLVFGLPVVGVVVGGIRLGVMATVAVAVAFAVLRRTAPARRSAAYDRELPEVLEAVARQLRAGGSLTQAVAGVEPPAGSPSGLATDWQRVVALAPAVGIGAALDDWADDRPPSVRLAAAALAMAAETGGSPARAVDGVATTLRSRQSVADELRALSSQARASAAVIALAPLGFGALAGATDDRTSAFFTTPAGLTLLAAGLTLDTVGAWWMSRLCRVAP